MKELIEWFVENKELVVLLCIAVSISIPISMHFGKTIVNNNIKKNNTTNHYNNNSQKQHNSNNNPQKTYNSSNTSGGAGVTKSNFSTNTKIEIVNIRLYSTGKKGKVYTTNFYKSVNHNFGIELKLRNNTHLLQNVKVGWCICKEGKDGKEVIKGTFNTKVDANKTVRTDFYVKEQAFKNLKTGKYKSLFWINDQRVQKVHFTISNK